ncbi:hypothetical protein SCMU_05310 [Sinomonas cyclohexanicum]|uniref:Uncharacterized protein n=1 Tax=Sinomonas cyclohexanicum TaxID=322009 RepID=A0ABM7PR64_SINCY|nr:hypothetical protein [Corynebacterium cyclohexanicum]BCT74689.1 hypothetical protein SCMU_05310 [Corynebacterium cyclohexanicum]
MSTPGPDPRRNPYRDPSAYWPDGVPPVAPPGAANQSRGELVRPGEHAPSPVTAGARRSSEPRPAKPVSRLATVLGGVSLGLGLLALTLGFVPWIGAVLAAPPLLGSVFGAWGSFARSKSLAARVSVMAIAGVALSVLHVVMLFVR